MKGVNELPPVKVSDNLYFVVFCSRSRWEKDRHPSGKKLPTPEEKAPHLSARLLHSPCKSKWHSVSSSGIDVTASWSAICNNECGCMTSSDIEWV